MAAAWAKQHASHLREGEADDAAREPGARVAGGARGLALSADLGVVALAEVVLELVDDDGAADDGVGADRSRDVRDLRRGAKADDDDDRSDARSR